MAMFPQLRFLALVCVLACAGCASIDAPPGALVYEVEIDGAGRRISKTIKESTQIFRFRDRPPSTSGQLRYRMEQDRETIEAILEANGYYDGTVNLYLDTTREPALVEVKVYRGEQYRFRKVNVQFTGKRDEALERIRVRLRKRQRVVANAVFQEEQRILAMIQRRGYPFPSLVRRVVNVDYEARKVDLTIVFDPGWNASFGEVQVEGLETLQDNYVHRQIPWNEGDSYDAGEMEDFERKLLGSGLFSSVRVAPAEVSGETNTIPVVIRLRERNKQTIRLGVNYSDIGPGVKGYWEHRSLFGGGEKMNVSVNWNPIELRGTTEFTRSGFLDAGQYLLLKLDGAQERPDAYKSDAVTATAMILRDLTSRLQAGVGAGYKYSRVEQLSTDERFAHIFFPVQGIYDTRNDRLNPISGMLVYGETAYYSEMLGSQSFQKSAIAGRHFMTLWNRYRLSTALRLTLGSIDAAAIDAVPADERFYAGGGGSIRGYEYQQVGPQIGGEPVGGDKLVEFSMELRMQPGRRLGYAAFLDGGRVYNEKVDNLDRSLNYGAGVGIRWFTAIGPLRVDAAYPLNPTPDQVERVQFYISLGQAF
jgi:translocation and assembly module TamA